VASNVSVIPICIDSEQPAAGTQVEAAREVTFLGSMHWPPNADGILWFAREVWPRVRARVPWAKLNIVGKNPPKALRERADPSIEVHAYLPDLQPVLGRTRVSIVPLRSGGGMRVKILDAWATGLAVVSTRIGAEGIAARDGENIMLADSAERFAEAVGLLLGDPASAARLASSGRQTVVNQYDWHRVYPRFSSLHGVPAAEAAAP
jgi:glycosyltransferase involved in cell wall biosynthesis